MSQRETFMFKMGGFYLTKNGRLVKLFNQFAFADGFVINGAVCDAATGTWTAARFKLDGSCNVTADYKIDSAITFQNYANYMTFQIFYDRAANCWAGRATDPYGAVIVNLNNLEGYERALKLILLGAEQKLLTWMHDAGYDLEKEIVDAE